MKFGHILKLGIFAPCPRLLPELTIEQRANPEGLQATHAQDSALPNLQSFSLLQGYPYTRIVTGPNRRGAW